MDGFVDGPEPRLIRSPDDAEQAAAAWLRHWGFADARVTPVGPDEGIDVVSNDLVAQVKAEMRPIGRPVIQNISGIGARRDVSAAVFALGGFTREAEQWAEHTAVALFSFDLQGEPQPANAEAHKLVSRRSAIGSSGASEVIRPPASLPPPFRFPAPDQDFRAAPLDDRDTVDVRRLAATAIARAPEGYGLAGGLGDVSRVWTLSADGNEDWGSAEVEVCPFRLKRVPLESAPIPTPAGWDNYTPSAAEMRSHIELVEDGYAEPRELADIWTLNRHIVASSAAEAALRAVNELWAVLRFLGLDLGAFRLELIDPENEWALQVHTLAQQMGNPWAAYRTMLREFQQSQEGRRRGSGQYDKKLRAALGLDPKAKPPVPLESQLRSLADEKLSGGAKRLEPYLADLVGCLQREHGEHQVTDLVGTYHVRMPSQKIKAAVAVLAERTLVFMHVDLAGRYRPGTDCQDVPLSLVEQVQKKGLNEIRLQWGSGILSPKSMRTIIAVDKIKHRDGFYEALARGVRKISSGEFGQ